MKIEIAKKDWNGYKLHEFLQFELTNNDEMDEFHALIYVRLIWITNRSGWSDSINVPTDYTAKQSRCHPKTYRKKMKDLESFGMITILKKSMNQYTSAEVTLKTEHLKNTMVALYLLSKKPSMPGNLEGKANGSPVASAWEPGGQGKVPHIKRKGADATLSENTEVKREAEPANAVPPAKETGRYAHYGLPDTTIKEFIAFLQEQGVDRTNVHNILLRSHNRDVVNSVVSDNGIKKEEIVKTISVIIQFLQTHPSPEGDETITALTLTPGEKEALKAERD